MTKTDLRALVNTLPETWRSKIIGRAAGANVKVLRMDGTASGEDPTLTTRDCWSWMAS